MPEAYTLRYGAQRIHGTAQRRVLRRRYTRLPYSIVYSFEGGESPETIRQNFSSLTPAQVYGAIAFYLAHKREIDANIRGGEEEVRRSVPHLSESRPELHARLERARLEIGALDLAKH